MKIRKHSLDGGDHYSPEFVHGTTNAEYISELLEVSASDSGYIATLGEYNGGTATTLKAVAINGTLVEQAL